MRRMALFLRIPLMTLGSSASLALAHPLEHLVAYGYNFDGQRTPRPRKHTATSRKEPWRAPIFYLEDIMVHKLRACFSLFLFFSVVGGQGLLLGGCSTFLSPSRTPSVTPGSHCQITYGSAGQPASPTHDCPMHNSGASQHDKSRCQCG